MVRAAVDVPVERVERTPREFAARSNVEVGVIRLHIRKARPPVRSLKTAKLAAFDIGQHGVSTVAEHGPRR